MAELQKEDKDLIYRLKLQQSVKILKLSRGSILSQINSLKLTKTLMNIQYNSPSLICSIYSTPFLTNSPTYFPKIPLIKILSRMPLLSSLH